MIMTPFALMSLDLNCTKALLFLEGVQDEDVNHSNHSPNDTSCENTDPKFVSSLQKKLQNEFNFLWNFDVSRRSTCNIDL
jgi:hypothetical protein